MHRFTFLMVMLMSVFAWSGDASAKYRNGWGWSKPLNAKQGAFYTTNRRFRTDLQSQPVRSQRSLPRTNRYQPRPTIIAPTQRYAPVFRRWR